MWEVKTSNEGAYIHHLLHLHFGIPTADIQTITTPFDVKLCLPNQLTGLHQHMGAMVGSKAALITFNGLVRNLKVSDEKLSLALLNASPIFNYLRYTSTVFLHCTPHVPALSSSDSHHSRI